MIFINNRLQKDIKRHKYYYKKVYENKKKHYLCKLKTEHQ